MEGGREGGRGWIRREGRRGRGSDGGRERGGERLDQEGGTEGGGSDGGRERGRERLDQEGGEEGMQRGRNGIFTFVHVIS